jgi:Domain of unknown function (DUF4276)
MNIGIVVDGRSEFRCLETLYPQLRVLTGNEFLRPVHADIQPAAPAGVIAHACESRITRLVGQGADLIVVLFDREKRPECSGELSTTVETELARREHHVRVVVKDSTFENWLVADVGALRASPARFKVSKRAWDSIQPDKADHVDALAVLKAAAVKRAYDKVADSKRILDRADPAKMGRHSRSFRKFLRCVGATMYAQQSRLPAEGGT